MIQRPRAFSLRSVLVSGLCAFAGGGLLGVGAGLHLVGDRGAQAPAPLADPTSVQEQREHPGPKEETSRPPTQLDIPVIGVASPLVELGLEPDHTVEVPVDHDVAGWFRRGPEPGQRGSAVILGHLDSSEGPAVFARLDELRHGDSVQVSRADGTVVEFVVIRSATYPNAEFPAQRVYAAQNGRRLNLVTCDGAFNPDLGGYQANLVVYTRRARSS